MNEVTVCIFAEPRSAPSIKAARCVCGQGMCCKDCAPHVLDGPLSVCTLVRLRCAHVLVCQCLSCVGHFDSATQADAILPPPAPPPPPSRNGSSPFFSVSSLLFIYSFFSFFFFLLLVTVTIGRPCRVSAPPTTKRTHFSPEVFVVGIHVNALLFNEPREPSSHILRSSFPPI